MTTSAIHLWLNGFALDSAIRAHVEIVIQRLPVEILDNFMTDPAFAIYDYDPLPRGTMNVPIRLVDRGRPGRTVVLKRTLVRRPVEFARWVIAHELAHAYLENRGRSPTEDPEHAADALAANWGFARP